MGSCNKILEKLLSARELDTLELLLAALPDRPVGPPPKATLSKRLREWIEVEMLADGYLEGFDAPRKERNPWSI